MELVLTGDHKMPARSISNLRSMQDVCGQTRAHRELALLIAPNEISGKAQAVAADESLVLQVERGHPAASTEGAERMR